MYTTVEASSSGRSANNRAGEYTSIALRNPKPRLQSAAESCALCPIRVVAHRVFELRGGRPRLSGLQDTTHPSSLGPPVPLSTSSVSVSTFIMSFWTRARAERSLGGQVPVAGGRPRGHRAHGDRRAERDVCFIIASLWEFLSSTRVNAE
ncbi:hypothetical protein B0H14DRAFT_2741827 [Mycena olivaceomarginata]|nr:hypothetical protein B0H14DRAFT_2741827 [Mycena olivaceomarginata]